MSDVIATAVFLVISSVGLLGNAVSLSFFIKTRNELGNALLAYMNIADILVSLSVFLFSLVAPAFQNYVISAVLMTVARHAFRSSMFVTGLITIYLNIVRTSAIIWPMDLVRFKKRTMHVSLALLMMIFVGIEAFLGVFCTYPFAVYPYQKMLGLKSSPPLPNDHPLKQFYNLEFTVFGTPIIFLVTVCCIVTATKLLKQNKALQQVTDNGARTGAAITVLIVSIQYVVCNTAALTFACLYTHYETRGGLNPAQLLQLFILSMASLVVNSALNPIVYICRVRKLREHFVSMVKCACFRERGQAQIESQRTVRETI